MGVFTSIPRLLTQIRETKTDRTLRNLEVKFERFDLVICDELGYIGFDKEGAEMLFNHLSQNRKEGYHYYNQLAFYQMGRSVKG